MDYKFFSDMQLLDLPVEILRIISSMLNFETKLKLATTCTLLRDLIFPVTIPIKKDTLKSAVVFGMEDFASIADRIDQTIDLSSIMDFSEQSCHGVKQMTNVRKMDVCYTNLNFDNIMEMAPPSLRDVTLNLTSFDNTILSRPSARKEVFNFLERITDIHFKLRRDFCEGPTYPYDTCLIHQNVKITYLGHRALSYSLPKFGDCMKYEPNFRTLTFSLNLLLPVRMYTFLYNLTLKNVDLLTYNFDQENNKLRVMMTQEVANALRNIENPVKMTKNHFKITNKTKIIDSVLFGHVKFICWNKKVIDDADYYGTIAEMVRLAIPTHICIHAHKAKTLINTDNDHVIVHDCVNSSEKNNVPLNFDVLINKRQYKTVTITRECYCRDITYSRHDMSLLDPIKGIFFNSIIENITYLAFDKVNFLNEVWERVFISIPNLMTLNIIGDAEIPTNNYKGLGEFVHLSKNLKHIKILEVGLDCGVLFQAFAKCQELEVIFIDSVQPIAAFDNEIDNYINLMLGCKKLTSLALENVYDDDRTHLARITELMDDLIKDQNKINFRFICISLSNYTNEVECITDRFFSDNILIL